jgi:hypothetical protein
MVVRTSCVPENLKFMPRSTKISKPWQCCGSEIIKNFFQDLDSYPDPALTLISDPDSDPDFYYYEKYI